jgi:hypothetical protein
MFGNRGVAMKEKVLKYYGVVKGDFFTYLIAFLLGTLLANLLILADALFERISLGLF